MRSGTWKRAIDGVPQTAVGGAQIAPANVVVQFTRYSGEAEGQTVGEGDAWVFTDGTVRIGRWVRPDKAQPAHYVDDTGAPILLRPGRTWVELLPVGATVDVTHAPLPGDHGPARDDRGPLHDQEEEEVAGRRTPPRSGNPFGRLAP